MSTEEAIVEELIVEASAILHCAEDMRLAVHGKYSPIVIARAVHLMKRAFDSLGYEIKAIAIVEDEPPK